MKIFEGHSVMVHIFQALILLLIYQPYLVKCGHLPCVAPTFPDHNVLKDPSEACFGANAAGMRKDFVIVYDRTPNPATQLYQFVANGVVTSDSPLQPRSP